MKRHSYRFLSALLFIFFGVQSASYALVEGSIATSGGVQLQNLYLQSQIPLSREDVRVLWKQHFASSEIIFPDPYMGLTDLLKIEPVCKDSSLKLIKALDQYEISASRSENEKLNQLQAYIHKVLSQAEKGPCFQSLAKLTTAKAMTFLAFDNRLITCENPTAGGSSCNYSITQNAARRNLVYFSKNKPTETALITDRWILNLIAISLLNNNAVEFLQLQESQKTPFAGSYQCAGTSKIALNPYLPLFDLAATYSHEMQHLFRDKFSTDHSLRSKDLLVLDEALASVYGGFLQRELHSFFQKKSGSDKVFNFLSALTSVSLPSVNSLVNHYDLRSDLNFFNEEGPLNSIWQAIGTGNAYGLSGWSDFLSFVFLRNNPNALYATSPEKQKSVLDPHVRSIYQIVKKAYFKENLSSDEFSDLNPRILSSDLDPLGQTLGRLSIPVRATLTDQELSEPYFIGDLKGDNKDGSPRTSLYFRIDALLEVLENLRTSLSQTSSACQDFQELVRQNQINNYIGVEKAPYPIKPEDSTSGGKPGLPVRSCIPWQKEF